MLNAKTNLMVQVPNYYDGMKSIVVSKTDGVTSIRTVTNSLAGTSYQVANEGDTIYHRQIGGEIYKTTLNFSNPDVGSVIGKHQLPKCFTREVLKWFLSDNKELRHLPGADKNNTVKRAKALLLDFFLNGIESFNIGPILKDVVEDSLKKHLTKTIVSFEQIKHAFNVSMNYLNAKDVFDKITFFKGLENEEFLKGWISIAKYDSRTAFNWRKAKKLPASVTIGNISNGGKSIRSNAVYIYDKDGKLLGFHSRFSGDRQNVFTHMTIDIAKKYPTAYKMVYMLFGYDSLTGTKLNDLTWQLYRVR